MKKRIIICCDGTWNDLEMRYITNVGRVAQALLPEGRDGVPQMIYYDDGVGADSSGLSRFIDGGVGIGLERNMYEAYRFLCFNFNDGETEEERDEVCLFGFSRGAYTVRSLAGMLGRVGLARRENLLHIPQALTAYRSGKRASQDTFLAACSRVIPVDLLACWDTVGALGIPDKIPLLPFDNIARKKYEFHDTNLGPHVRLALHAVAIDERRKEFEVTCMEKLPDAPAHQTLKQVWFPGDHGSVGGGSWEKRGLSNRALRWILNEAAEHVGLGVDLERLADKAVSDGSVYFDPAVSFIYGKKNRTLDCTISDLDPSVIRRWKEHRDYRPPRLKAKFGKKLEATVIDDIRQPPAKLTTLAPGETAHARVLAATQRNRTRIHLEKDARYVVRISTLQVWKDGDLDPCGVLGWELDAPADALKPWKEGKRHQFNSVQRAMIKAAQQKRVVREAPWFAILYAIDDDDFNPLPLSPEKDAPSCHRSGFAASRNGELVFAANDLASRWDLIDKYDNNQGWIWLEVHREKP